MIVIRLDCDWITNYIYKYTDFLIDHAKKRGFNVCSIEGTNINFRNIEKRIKKLKPSFIVYNGHGSTTSLCDNAKEEFVNLGNAHMFKKTIAFVRACNALVGLGQTAIKEECKAFIGYKTRFWLAKKHGMESRPLKDPIAKPILDTSNRVVIELLNGKTVRYSVNKSHEAAKEVFLSLLFSNDPYARVSLPPLMWNDKSLDFEGDPNARLT